MSRDDARAGTSWGPGTSVSVSRLPGPDTPMARAIGIGELTARLEVGRPIGLRLDAGERGRVLAATAIVRIEAVGPDTLRIATRNHRYELRRVAAIVAGRANPDANDETGSRADATRIVSVDAWPEATPGRFESGARVGLVQERDGERRELGPAILLADLVAGEPASFAVEGRVVATSPVREVIESGKRTIRIETGRSSYVLELLVDEEDGQRG